MWDGKDYVDETGAYWLSFLPLQYSRKTSQGAKELHLVKYKQLISMSEYYVLLNSRVIVANQLS